MIPNFVNSVNSMKHWVNLSIHIPVFELANPVNKPRDELESAAKLEIRVALPGAPYPYITYNLVSTVQQAYTEQHMKDCKLTTRPQCTYIRFCDFFRQIK